MSNQLQNHVGIGKESSYGTAVAPTVFFIPQEVKGMNIDMDRQYNEGVKGTAPKNKNAFSGIAKLEGGYEMDLYPLASTYVLHSALGGVNSALESGETEVYKHTFTESFTKPSYTVEEKFGEVIKRYAGYVAQKFTVEVKKGETAKISFAGMAKSQNSETPATASYETTRPFNFADVSTLTIGGVSVLTHAQEVSFEYDNGLVGRPSLGDNYIKGVVAGKSEMKGKILMYLDSTTKDFIEDHITNTQRAIDFILTGDAIGEESNNSYRIYIAKADIQSYSEEITDNYNMLELSFEAVEDATDGIVRVEVINTITTL